MTLERIAVIDTEHGGVTVLHDKSTGVVRYVQHFCSQSEADKDGVSLATYIHAIFGLLMQARCQRVLLIGCGGGTLATMLRGARFNVTVVDVNPWSFQIARDYFCLPPDVECHVADGSEYLLACGREWDAIVLDAYHRGEIPAQFRSREFLALVAARLSTPNGCFFANVCSSDLTAQAADALALALSKHMANPRILDCDALIHCNAIVMAGDVANLRRPKLLVPPRRQAKFISLCLDRFAIREPTKLSKRIR